MLWRAAIVLRDGTQLDLISGLEIKAVMFEATETAVFTGEHDTIGVPFAQLAYFHVYEQGVTL